MIEKYWFFKAGRFHVRWVGIVFGIIALIFIMKIGSTIGAVLGAVILPLKILESRVDFNQVKDTLTDPINRDQL